MRLADTRPPFAGLANLSEAALAALPTPCYLLDEARLRRNGEILLGVQQRTGCKILLAQKAFSNYDLYPVLAPYLAGTEACLLYTSVVRELTRYDRVERIDLVEMDPQVVEACRAYLPGNACRMDDRRVHIYFENALKYIRRCEEEYDLIIVDSSDPFGPSEGLFTRCV